jgi:predicted Zn-dependent peptidase
VLGTTETITALPRQRMKAYFDDRYAADNTVVAMAGKLDFDRMVDLIGERCGSWWHRRRTPIRLRRRSWAPTSRSATRKSPAGTCLPCATRRPSRTNDATRPESSPQILGTPDNSRLHWALMEPGLAEEAQASFDAHDGFGEFFVYASGEPERLESGRSSPANWPPSPRR